MNALFAAALVWRLVILPTGGTKTDENKDLFKPFDTPKTFSSEADCRADAAANLTAYLAARGLPSGAVANFGCTTR